MDKFNQYTTEFVARSQVVRAQAHVAHLATRSYAKHMALGDYYDAVTDTADTVCEAAQGMEPAYSPSDLLGNAVTFSFVNDGGIVAAIKEFDLFVEEFIAYIESEEENEAVEFIANELMNLQTLNRKTLYKLQFLS